MAKILEVMAPTRDPDGNWNTQVDIHVGADTVRVNLHATEGLVRRAIGWAKENVSFGAHPALYFGRHGGPNSHYFGRHGGPNSHYFGGRMLAQEQGDFTWKDRSFGPKMTSFWNADNYFTKLLAHASGMDGLEHHFGGLALDREQLDFGERDYSFGPGMTSFTAADNYFDAVQATGREEYPTDYLGGYVDDATAATAAIQTSPVVKAASVASNDPHRAAAKLLTALNSGSPAAQAALAAMATAIESGDPEAGRAANALGDVQQAATLRANSRHPAVMRTLARIAQGCRQHDPQALRALRALRAVAQGSGTMVSLDVPVGDYTSRGQLVRDVVGCVNHAVAKLL